MAIEQIPLTGPQPDAVPRGKARGELIRFVKYGLVGVLGAIVDFTVLNTFVFILGWSSDMGKLMANVISTTAAILSNFIWNRLWTFPEAQNRNRFTQLLQFATVASTGLVFNSLIFVAADNYLFSQFLPEELSLQFAKAMAIGIVMFWNFGLNRLWTFRGINEEQQPMNTTNTIPTRNVISLGNRWLRAAAVMVMAIVGAAVIAVVVLAGSPQVSVRDGQQAAYTIASSTLYNPDVEYASGAYLPGEGIVLYSRVAGDVEQGSWFTAQLAAHEALLAEMAAGESLTWIVDYGTPLQQIVMQAPLQQAGAVTNQQFIANAIEGLPFDPVKAPPAPQVEAEPDVEPAPAEPVADEAPVEPEPEPVEEAVADPIIEPAAVEPLTAGVVASNFEADADGWAPLNGSWRVVEGQYVQEDASGFDYISMLDKAAFANYTVDTDLRYLGDGLSAGLVVGAPDVSSRAGAQIIDLTDQGSFLRWGRYDESGNYVYDGGMALETSLGDGQWHTLRLIARPDAIEIYLDGQLMATIENGNPAGGRVGLVTSQAEVAFDNVTVEASEGVAEVEAAPLIPLAQFDDNFDDNQADGWSVANGDWQVVDGTYQQVDVAAQDAVSLSPFRSDRYRFAANLRAEAGEMFGGLIFNAAQPDSRNGSHFVRYVNNGPIIEWGYFAEDGAFVAEGGSEVPNGADGAWHTLAVEVQEGTASFFLDDVRLTEGYALTFTGGLLGLYAHNGHVAFDEVTMTTTGDEVAVEETVAEPEAEVATEVTEDETAAETSQEEAVAEEPAANEADVEATDPEAPAEESATNDEEQDF